MSGWVSRSAFPGFYGFSAEVCSALCGSKQAHPIPANLGWRRLLGWFLPYPDCVAPLVPFWPIEAAQPLLFPV